MSLHVAPLPAHPFGGGFQKTPTSGNFFGMAPDRQLMAFVQKCSRGALSRGDTGKERKGYHPLPEDKQSGCRVFDPRSDLVFKYRNRRAFYDKGRLASNASGVMYLRVAREKRRAGTGALAQAPTVAGTGDAEGIFQRWIELNGQMAGLLGKVQDADSAREHASSLSRVADQYVELLEELGKQRIPAWEQDRLKREYGDKVKNSNRRFRSELRRVEDIQEAAEVLEASLERMKNAVDEADKLAPGDS
jgi:hypothetical protein